jgi:hypothetical protein
MESGLHHIDFPWIARYTEKVTRIPEKCNQDDTVFQKKKD